MLFLLNRKDFFPLLYVDVYYEALHERFLKTHTHTHVYMCIYIFYYYTLGIDLR